MVSNGRDRGSLIPGRRLVPVRGLSGTSGRRVAPASEASPALRPLPSPSIASSALPRSPGRRFSWDRRSLVPTRLGTAGLGDEPRSKPLRKPADAAARRGGRPALRGLAQAWRSLPRSGQLPARPGQVRLPLQCPRPTGGPDRVNKPMFNIDDNQMKRICELCVIFDNFL